MLKRAKETPDSDAILATHELNEEILGKLFRDEICILRVHNYASPEVISALRRFMYNGQQHFIRSYYVGYKKQEPVRKFFGVHLWGMPYNSTYYQGPDDEASQKYHDAAITNLNTLRRYLSPQVSPIDRLRLHLDEHWTPGARLARFVEGKRMFVGIGRFVYAKDSFLGETQPHFDSLPQHVRTLEKQFSANVYTDIPYAGGELEVWNVPPLTPEEILQIPIGKRWRAVLPPPLVVKPQVGELILFNTRRPHAVRGFENGIRSSMQCFIGMHKDHTLEYWS